MNWWWNCFARKYYRMKIFLLIKRPKKSSVFNFIYFFPSDIIRKSLSPTHCDYDCLFFCISWTYCPSYFGSNNQ